MSFVLRPADLLLISCQFTSFLLYTIPSFHDLKKSCLTIYDIPATAGRQRYFRRISHYGLSVFPHNDHGTERLVTCRSVVD
jgi:hypothetical protein